jgi:predicted permease
MMNSTAADDDSAILLNNLLPALAEIFIITLMGWACVRFDAIPVEYGTALGRFAGYYALPSIILVNMSQIKLGDASIGLILSMLVAKVSVASLVGGMGYVLLPAPLDPSKAPRNWSMCACFSMLCVSSNDFALGLPILDAIYPPEEGMLSMRDYLFLFSPMTLAITTPAAFAVLELAAAVSPGYLSLAAPNTWAVQPWWCLCRPQSGGW